MGTKARIVLFAPDESSASAAAAGAFARIEELDTVMSDYRADSEVSFLAEQPVGRWTPISDDLFTVLEQAGLVSAKTSGAFDATIGRLVALWRQARKTGILPLFSDLRDAHEQSGWRAVELDHVGQMARITRPGIRIDLGGIGKGYAADAALGALRDAGYVHAMIDFGGDLALGSPPPGARGWQIRISNTLSQDRILSLSDTCLATSGDAEQFVLIDGRRYSHIVDPRTGSALSRRRAATVIYPEGGIADALASAACVLGPKGVLAIRHAFPDAVVHLAAPDDLP